MRYSRRLVLFTISTVALTLVALGIAPPAQASTGRVRSVRGISGPSPLPAVCSPPRTVCESTTKRTTGFTACSTDDDCSRTCSMTTTLMCMADAGCPPGETCVHRETCTSQVGEEYEPHIAVNPVHRRNLIAVYSQDNQVNTVVSTSRDGGRHWTQVPVPGLSGCTEGTAVGGGDPRVSIGPDGIAYASSLVTEPSNTSGVLVNTSTDGGLSWSAPVAVDQNQPVVDFPVVVADPRLPRTAYITWTRQLVLLTFSRTTDGGATWTPPAMIPVEPDPVAMTGPGGGQIRVLPDGTLVDVFTQIHAGPAGPTGVWVVRSQNQGDSWSSPIRVVEEDIPANVVTDPDSGNGIGRGVSYEPVSVAVGTDGTLYVAWHLITSTVSSQILFVKSVDGGLTWTDPSQVAGEATQAFLPTVAASPAGTVGVTYFDFRNDVLGDAELTTDLWFRHSHDGGATWSETHLAGPFDLRPVPSPGLYPLGDYFGLVPIRRNGFGAAWIQTIPPQGQGTTDAFFARIRVSPRQ
jgi:hypothetical protein